MIFVVKFSLNGLKYAVSSGDGLIEQIIRMILTMIYDNSYLFTYIRSRACCVVINTKWFIDDIFSTIF